MATARERALTDTVREAAGQVVDPLGVELVHVVVRRAKTRWHVRLDVDRAGTRGVNLDDCQQVSRGLDTILEEQDLIPGSYTLEVSSPGIDRPIESDDDFRRNTGRKVRVESSDREGVTRAIVGTLKGFEAATVQLETEDGEAVEIERETIVKARQEIGF